MMRAAGDWPEILANHRFCLRNVDVTSDYQHGVVRSVVGLEEVVHVGDVRGGEIIHRADDRMAVWVIRGKHCPLNLLEPGAIGLVVHALATLVLHDFALVVELNLVDGLQQVAHAVRLEPQRKLELV